MTAHQLYAMRPDAVVVSYEFVENCYRPIKCFLDGKSKVRPTSALHSEFWDLQGYPIKRLILDEAHRIGNTQSARYVALKAVPAEVTALFSGTFPHNRWYGWAELIAFAKHQPFIDLSTFRHGFASYNYDNRLEQEPAMSRLMLLLRFPMRFTVARPASVLDLPDALHYKYTFDVDNEGLATSEEC